MFVKKGKWIKFIARHLSRAQMRQVELDNQFGLFIQQFILKSGLQQPAFLKTNLGKKMKITTDCIFF
jgi:hypothetical protein